MKTWTITVELKSGEQKAYAVKGDTAAHAKNRLRNRVEVQFVKESRPWNRETDASLERVS